MRTSYLAKSGTHKDAVCVCSGRPHFYKGRMYTKLGPKQWFLDKYKKDGDADFYTIQFKKEVLDLLDPREVFEELGENAILICWEGKDKFCHRHLVAEWLSSSLNIEIEEIL